MNWVDGVVLAVLALSAIVALFLSRNRVWEEFDGNLGFDSSGCGYLRGATDADHDAVMR